MKASPWQTLLLALITAASPYVLTVSTGGTISYRTTIAAVLYSLMVAGANLLRSPMNDPKSIFPNKPADPPPGNQSGGN